MSSDQERAHLKEWWETLTENQRNRLKDAMRTYPADPSIVNLLTSCPIEAVKGSWTATSIANSGHAIAIHEPLKSFVEGKLGD